MKEIQLMRIIFWGKGDRALRCFEALQENGYSISLIITHPQENTAWYSSLFRCAKKLNIEFLAPENPNTVQVEQKIRSLSPDLLIFAGYGKIINQNLIDIPSIMSINLHGGKLPEYRGSSPMNWVLINGENSFTLTIIRMDAGVDTGDILMEKTFDISLDDTILDLHSIANKVFPLMLLEVVSSIENVSYTLVPQDESLASYYPLRFPDDGLVFFDQLTSRELHNRIRALTEPYPCAFTLYKGRRVNLVSSKIHRYDYFGEPGRIYKISSGKGLLVCAKDKCLWIKGAYFADDSTLLENLVSRYDKMDTISSIVARWTNMPDKWSR